MVTLPSSVDEEELKVVASESVVVLFSHHSFPYFGFSTLISCVPVLHSWSVIVFMYVHIYLDLCTRVRTRVNRLWPVAILTKGAFFYPTCLRLLDELNVEPLPLTRGEHRAFASFTRRM